MLLAVSMYAKVFPAVLILVLPKVAVSRFTVQAEEGPLKLKGWVVKGAET